MSTGRKPTKEQIDAALVALIPVLPRRTGGHKATKPMSPAAYAIRRDTQCRVCGQELEFGTDREGSATQTCGCGRHFVLSRML